jgi:hypothetical protein
VQQRHSRLEDKRFRATTSRASETVQQRDDGQHDKRFRATTS